MKLARVSIHPATIKELHKNHPHITSDRYSLCFPKNAPLVYWYDEKKDKKYFFLHDPLHQKIKARLWKVTVEKRAEDSFDFIKELNDRFERVLEEKGQLFKSSERENFFWLFGEADGFPGLRLISFNDTFVFQAESFFWKQFKDVLIKKLRSMRNDVQCVYWQERTSSGESGKLEKILGDDLKQATINEFGVNYTVFFDDAKKDFGLFTDMAFVRKEMKQRGLFEGRNLLNLFAHTGAFSFFAMKNGATQTHSVDLSPTWMDVFYQNREHNKLENCTYTVGKVEDYLEESKDTFQVILCDPPPVLTIKEKKMSVMNFYQRYLNKMIHLLDKEKGTLVLFCNNHSIKMSDFEKEIKKINNKLKIKGYLGLGEDCTVISSFNEGNYIKGVILEIC